MNKNKIIVLITYIFVTIALISFLIDFTMLISLLMMIVCASCLIIIRGTEIDYLKSNVTFNLFATAFLFSLINIFRCYTENSNQEITVHIIIGSFAPMIFAFIMYLPLVNIIKSIEATINHEEDTKKKLELSRREKEVYLLVIEDHSNVEIAEELFIAESTVKKHIQNIMKKANCNKREELKEFDV